MAREKVHGKRKVTVTHEDGRQSESFEFDLPYIRSVKGFIQGTWSYDEVNNGLSGKNGFSDVDGHVERFGRGLILEFKQSIQTLNKGQVLKAVRMAKYQKTCTWFIIGETNQPSQIFCINETSVEGEYRVTEIEDTNMEEIKARIVRWELWAKQHRMNPTSSNEWTEVNKIMYKVWSSK